MRSFWSWWHVQRKMILPLASTKGIRQLKVDNRWPHGFPSACPPPTQTREAHHLSWSASADDFLAKLWPGGRLEAMCQLMVVCSTVDRERQVSARSSHLDPCVTSAGVCLDVVYACLDLYEAHTRRSIQYVGNFCGTALSRIRSGFARHRGRVKAAQRRTRSLRGVDRQQRRILQRKQTRYYCTLKTIDRTGAV